MNKLQHFAFAFGIALIATAVSAPVFAQSANLDFGRGNSINVNPSGTTFGFNGNTVRVNNFGGSFSNGNSSLGFGSSAPDSSIGRTYDLNPAYPSAGMRYVPPPAGAFGAGAGGNQFASSGTQGDMGRMSQPTPANLADSDRSLFDYQSDPGNRQGSQGTQTPVSGGGLPQTNTALRAPLNDYGMTQIPSGQFKYGFGNYGPALLKSPTGFASQGFGGMLPQTSTGSLDINTVDP